VIDEVQKAPAILNVVHDLLEKPGGQNLRFILTGSSSRKLKSAGADLLAGRALTLEFHPFIAKELGEYWNLETALKQGMLPVVWNSEDPQGSLRSYIGTYLKEEVLQERLVRNLESFARFLEVMTFSQGSPLNTSAMARESSIGQKAAEGYVSLVEDLLIGSRLSVFQKKAKRELSVHPKFYYFDCGVFRSLHPMGALDEPHQIEGQVLETLVYQHLKAWISYHDPSLNLYFWRTRSEVEVDFILYGKEEFVAIEVKNSSRIRMEDLKGLRSFGEDYPQAKLIYLYRGEKRERHFENILCLPVDDFLRNLDPSFSLEKAIQEAI
jgi:predicted AAA+ superfamily ATPase